MPIPPRLLSPKWAASCPCSRVRFTLIPHPPRRRTRLLQQLCRSVVLLRLSTLHTTTREEGQRLAALPAALATLPDYLCTAAPPPDRATLATIYFHAIAVVNAG